MEECACAREMTEGGAQQPDAVFWDSRREGGGLPYCSDNSSSSQPRSRRISKRRRLLPMGRSFAYGLVASSIPAAMGQNCISLADSAACSAFEAASISTNSNLTALFPFLSSVTDTASFDSGIQEYISNGFTQLRYEQLIGCSNVNLDNTTAFYARYTTTVLCNAIVQNSAQPCDLTNDALRPLCADSCADYAQSEQEITASNVCGNAGSDALTQIRADFTNCALPANSLTGSCISATVNEPNECGFSSNVGSLCSYCAASSPNATDSCCVFSNSTSRCQDVTLPVIASSALQQIVTTLTTSAGPSGTAQPVPQSANPGLTGGQIAGIVIGAILGALALLALIIFGCVLLRKRRASSPATSVFNQPATMKQVPPSSSYTDGAHDQERAGLAVLPGGRVARMSALEGPRSPSNNGHSPMLAGGYRKSTSSDEEQDSPASRGLLGPPTTGKRSGSLSSASRLGMVADIPTTDFETSPSTDQYTSPESGGRSEQLAFFKDYYSQDEVHPSDIVATLWAYEPRAADEFHLDRGDMIKIIGIWDDGWATGVRVRVKADEWRPEDKVQRDSGMTNGSSGSGSGGRTLTSSEGEGEVKAFPMVCVCLPQHWRRTIEGDSTEGTGPYP